MTEQELGSYAGRSGMRPTRRCLIALAIFAVAGIAHASTGLPCLDTVLESLHRSGYPAIRPNPFLATAEDLLPQSTIYLDRSAGARLPRVFENISSWPAPFTVVERRQNVAGWMGAREIIYLHSPQTGQIGVPTEAVTEHGFLRHDYMSFAPHQEGELVVIGRTGELKTIQAKTMSQERPIIKMDETALPLPARFQRVLDEGTFLLELMLGLPAMVSLVAIPREMVFATPTGSAARFRDRIRPLLAIPIEFSEQERVRFRDGSGNIQTGTFVRARNQSAQIKPTGASESVIVPLRQVFKWDGKGEPFTPLFETVWFETHGVEPKSLYSEALDAAARFLSHPEWLNATLEKRLLYITALSRVLLAPTEDANNFPGGGLDTMDKILMAGYGDCKYESELAAAIASEAGYETALVWRVPKNPNVGLNRIGHVWAEVHEPGDPRNEGYYVDPGYRMISAVRNGPRMAAASRRSAPAEWYLHRGRRYVNGPHFTRGPFRGRPSEGAQ